MNVFEAQLIALAESMATQLVSHLIAKLEAKLGVSLVVPPQAVNPPTDPSASIAP